MILGFKEEFIPKVLDGTKIHSLREGERWKADTSIQFFGKVRQKGMYKFKEDGVCSGVQDVVMELFKGKLFIAVNNEILGEINTEKFIIKDGFKSEIEFKEFFFPIKTTSRQLIKRQLVHWTDFRY